MQSPGKQSTGNTQVSPPPAVQVALLVQRLPPTEQVPDAHCAEVVHDDPSSAHREEQSASRKQPKDEPMHWPGMHVPDAHPAFDVHAVPPGALAAQTGIGTAEGSQKRSSWHCDVDTHGAPAGSFGWQIPATQWKSLAQPLPHGNPAVGFAVHFWFGAQKLSGAPAQSWPKKHAPPTATVPTHAKSAQDSFQGSSDTIIPHESSGATSAFRHAFIRSASNLTRPAVIESFNVRLDRSQARMTSSRHCRSVRGSLTFKKSSISPSVQHW
jgi:hypothetical protein